MAGNARFHNKWHRRSHHSLPSTGYPDSGTDPIGSPEEPFYGDFVTYNSISAHENLFVDGNAQILGNLSVLGDFTYLDTIVSVTSALSVVNHGTGPAMTVVQYGAQPIARFIDADAPGTNKDALFIDDDGLVVIDGAIPKTQFTPDTQGSPEMNLTVNGNIYASKGVYYETESASTIYCSPSGNDSNSGLNPSQKVKTIKKACKIAFDRSPKKYNIVLEAGNYEEENPIYVPTGTSIIGEGFLRTTNLFSKNRQLDFFWFNTACYLWGVTFRNTLEPAAACAFPNLLSSYPGYYAAFNTPGYEINVNRSGGPFGLKLVSPPFVTTSPYIQGCSSITRGLTATLQNTNPQQILGGTLYGLSAVNAIADSFDTVTKIIIGGTNNFTNLSYSIPAQSITDAVALINANILYIAKETVAYVNTVYPKLVYDPATCERDLRDYILPGIITDLNAGNNDQSITNGQFYYSGGGRVIPTDQIVPTVVAIEFAKRLTLLVAANQTVPALGGGCGIRVDGSLALGFLRSFVTDSFTQFNQGGKGIHILNCGYAQLVSTFTICTTEGVHCESGGQCSISTSNCSFGLSGLVANGKSVFPVLTGYQYRTTPQGINEIFIRDVTPKPLSAFVTALQQGFVLSGIPIERPYDGLLIKAFGDPRSEVNAEINPNGDTFYHEIVAVSATSQYGDGDNAYRITLNSNLLVPLTADPSIDPPGRYVEFYLRSIIASSTHAFEYIGTGTELEKAVPALGGIVNNANEAVFSDNGIVYYSSTNEKGDFKVGSGFTIVQGRSTIEGLSYDKSVLALVTPLILALE